MTFNPPFYNLTTHPELNNSNYLFNLGLKHIPHNQQLTRLELCKAIEQFTNKTLWRLHHETKLHHLHPEERDLTLLTSSFNSKLKDKQKITPPCNLIPKNHNIHDDLTLLKTKLLNTYDRFKPKQSSNFIYKKLRNMKRKYPDVTFIPADKNLGLVALPTTLFKKLIMDHLDNQDNYALITDNPLSNAALLRTLIRKFKAFTSTNLTHSANTNNTLYYFSDQETSFIKSFHNPTFPNFYILPKIHKPGTLKGRPIAGATNFITTPISIILNIHLTAYLEDYPLQHTVSNSFIVANELANSNFQNPLIITADINSLYPNIKKDIIYDIFQNDINLYHLAQLVHFVLDHSYVQFDNKIYKQLAGIPMGTNCAVNLANIYLDRILDCEFASVINSQLFTIQFYKRYIDDIILVICNERNMKRWVLHDLSKRLKKAELTIEYNFQTSNACFLDLEIFSLAPTRYQPHTKLFTRLYQKPNAKFNYISPSSLHTRATLTGFIKGELTRFSRCSTFNNDYNNSKNIFKNRLIQRGYSYKFLNPIFNAHHLNIKFFRKPTKDIVTNLNIPLTNKLLASKLTTTFNKYKTNITHWFKANTNIITFKRLPNIDNIICNRKIKSS